MGPAVLKGGFSTFLSIILLANSNSHVFETFFKVWLLKTLQISIVNNSVRTKKPFYLFQIFFLVVTFALYNGLVVLPIILSHIGPEEASHIIADPNITSKTENIPEEDLELNTKMISSVVT